MFLISFHEQEVFDGEVEAETLEEAERKVKAGIELDIHSITKI